jgi:hypothetical protein
MDPTKRILELAGHGLTDAEIAKKLKTEGFKNAKGRAFNPNAVRSRRLRAEKTSGKTKPSDIPETSDKRVDRSDKSAISDAMREEIRGIVREEIQAAMEGQRVPTIQTQSVDLPPLPGKVTGPHGKPIGEGGRVKLAGTVDERLEMLFQEWRKERGISLSRALDAALWHFLGKPPLSFEITDKSDETEQ